MTNPWNNYSWAPKDEPNEPANDELLSRVRTDQEFDSDPRAPVSERGSGSYPPSVGAGDSGIHDLDPIVFKRTEP